MSHQLVRHRIAAYCIDGEAVTALTTKGGAIKRRTIRELYEMKKTSHGRSRLKLVKLNCMDESTGLIVQNRVKDVLFNGQKECVEILASGGYIVRATKDHQFYTPEGWMPLGEALEKGLEVATNGIPVPSEELLREEYLVKNRPRKEVAAELGMSDAWLGRYIAKYGLQKHKSQYPNRQGGHGNPGMHGIGGREAIGARMRGAGNHRWRGGITPKACHLNQKVTRLMREEIRARDQHTCRLCEEKGLKLEIHHVVPVWQDESLVTELDNIVSLCHACHLKVNCHEHEYAEKFGALKPVLKRPRTQRASTRKSVTFREILAYQDVGFIDTYDIVMADPHHNFIANGFTVHNSQESQRYCSYAPKPADIEAGNDKPTLEVILPPSIGEADPDTIMCASVHGGVFSADAIFGGIVPTGNTQAYVEWLRSTTQAYTSYLEIVNAGVAKEDARSVLPNCTKTEVATTFNIREWRHFFDMRCDSHAQWQIRELANQCLKTLFSYNPLLFKDQMEEFNLEV